MYIYMYISMCIYIYIYIHTITIKYIHNIWNIRTVMDLVWAQLGCPAISGCNLARLLGRAEPIDEYQAPKMDVFIWKTRENL